MQRGGLQIGVWLLAALLWPQPTSAQRLRVEIGGANFRPYPVASPALAISGGDAQAGATAAAELTGALQRGVDLLRSLELVPPKTYLQASGEPTHAPNFANWSQVGASGLIRGSVQSDGQRTKVSLRFFDVAARREVFHNDCSQDSLLARVCVHKFLDDVVEQVTGQKGIFSARIAFVRRTGKQMHVFTCDIDGANVERLTDRAALNLLPSWDTSGRYVLLTSYLNGNPDLYRIDIASRRWLSLSHAKGLNTGGVVSPDGTQIALTLSKDGNTEIYVMNADGRNARRLTDSLGQDLSPTWSPDGKRLAFVSSRSGAPHIYVMSAEGAGVRRLTFQGNYNQEPDWSPRSDGQIAFTARDESLKYDIFLVHPDTGTITRLTQDDAHNESPSFAPDGHQLVFTSTRGRAHKKMLWVMDADGRNQRPLSMEVGDYETPSWGPRLGY